MQILCYKFPTSADYFIFYCIDTHYLLELFLVIQYNQFSLHS